jgi:hypothetical protein
MAYNSNLPFPIPSVHGCNIALELSATTWRLASNAGGQHLCEKAIRASDKETVEPCLAISTRRLDTFNARHRHLSLHDLDHFAALD